MTTDTTERGLERLICTALAGHPCDPPPKGGEHQEPEAQPGGAGWTAGDPRDYDRSYCVDLVQLSAFLQATQPEAAALAPRRSVLVERQGFILDVLNHYTPVKSYYRLAKSVEDDPELNHLDQPRELVKGEVIRVCGRNTTPTPCSAEGTQPSSMPVQAIGSRSVRREASRTSPPCVSLPTRRGCPPTSAMTDIEITKKIACLETSIESWARQKRLWSDTSFFSYQKRFDAEPQECPVVSVLATEGPLNDVLFQYSDDDLYEEFYELLHSMGYEFEQYDSVSLHIYPEKVHERREFFDYFQWQWICSLVEEEFSDIYHEIYSRFGENTDALRQLKWRQFEKLLASIFRNQGYDVELGPGTGDGGVDLKLLQRDPIGDILTFVQAKKYAPHRKITLEPVQALYGASVASGVTSSVFVTTSEYLPSARTFAARENVHMDLYTSADVVDWCRHSRNGIIRDKSLLTSEAGIRTAAKRGIADPTRLILHGQSFVRGTHNTFALILKETEHAALLMRLPSSNVEDDGYGQQGKEIPDLRQLLRRRAAAPQPEEVWRAKKKRRSDGTVYFWDGRHLFSRWAGEPVYFDHCD